MSCEDEALLLVVWMVEGEKPAEDWWMAVDMMTMDLYYLDLQMYLSYPVVLIQLDSSIFSLAAVDALLLLAQRARTTTIRVALIVVVLLANIRMMCVAEFGHHFQEIGSRTIRRFF
jgi:hypothetical protein